MQPCLRTYTDGVGMPSRALGVTGCIKKTKNKIKSK